MQNEKKVMKEAEEFTRLYCTNSEGRQKMNYTLSLFLLIHVTSIDLCLPVNKLTCSLLYLSSPHCGASTGVFLSVSYIYRETCLVYKVVSAVHSVAIQSILDFIYNKLYNASFSVKCARKNMGIGRQY